MLCNWSFASPSENIHNNDPHFNMKLRQQSASRLWRRSEITVLGDTVDIAIAYGTRLRYLLKYVIYLQNRGPRSATNSPRMLTVNMQAHYRTPVPTVLPSLQYRHMLYSYNISTDNRCRTTKQYNHLSFLSLFFSVAGIKLFQLQSCFSDEFSDSGVNFPSNIDYFTSICILYILYRIR